MAETQIPPAQDAGAANMVQFAIERIYVKDLSLENPGSPQSFQLQEPPQVEVQLRTRSDAIAQDVYESVLTITVTARPAPTPKTPAETGSMSNQRPDPSNDSSVLTAGILITM